jgi:hypothetical protein
MDDTCKFRSYSIKREGSIWKTDDGVVLPPSLWGAFNSICKEDSCGIMRGILHVSFCDIEIVAARVDNILLDASSEVLSELESVLY